MNSLVKLVVYVSKPIIFIFICMLFAMTGLLVDWLDLEIRK